MRIYTEVILDFCRAMRATHCPAFRRYTRIQRTVSLVTAKNALEFEISHRVLFKHKFPDSA